MHSMQIAKRQTSNGRRAVCLCLGLNGLLLLFLGHHRFKYLLPGIGNASLLQDGKKICHDLDADCPGFAHRGDCHTNENWMVPNCAFSCKLCEPDSCVDQDEQCAEWSA
eukprot:SAG11_NODE_13305_length_661_cov_0.855872_1_plen_108_part_10